MQILVDKSWGMTDSGWCDWRLCLIPVVIEGGRAWVVAPAIQHVTFLDRACGAHQNCGVLQPSRLEPVTATPHHKKVANCLLKYRTCMTAAMDEHAVMDVHGA